MICESGPLLVALLCCYSILRVLVCSFDRLISDKHLYTTPISHAHIKNKTKKIPKILKNTSVLFFLLHRKSYTCPLNLETEIRKKTLWIVLMEVFCFLLFELDDYNFFKLSSWLWYVFFLILQFFLLCGNLKSLT